jgi:mannose-1-phosphate guanylyltransferase/mannose-6-phosphate isomerase
MIYPTILCGGSGTRLWPLSRKSYPKQFAQILGDETLFQASARRLSGPDFAPPLIVTNSDFRFIATQQLAEIGIAPSAVLIEPTQRNTAPAVAAATVFALQNDPDALLLIAPSDHAIPDDAAFRAAVMRGMTAANAGQIVTFGITPTRPETGYGYLELQTAPTGDTAAPLRRFVEKPQPVAAQSMLEAGNFLWNAGIFLFRADVMIKAFADHAPQVLTAVQRAIAAAKSDLGFLRLDPDAWAGAPNISIDYAVMEHAKNLSAVPFSGEWSDFGGWDAVWAGSNPDALGVALSGSATAIDCGNTLLRSDSDGVEIVGIGLKNIIAVAMNDAVLIADMSRAQDVKLAVDALRTNGARQAEAFPKDHRPWGWFERLALGERFQVKRIHVAAGAALSLQSHHHRAEHWIVVQGTAEVTIDGQTRLVSENQSVYIPLGSKHRLTNPGKLPIVLIEVQTGSYLGEDDIIRFDDIYARGQGAKG